MKVTYAAVLSYRLRQDHYYRTQLILQADINPFINVVCVMCITACLSQCYPCMCLCVHISVCPCVFVFGHVLVHVSVSV